MISNSLIFLMQSKLVIMNILKRNKLVLRNNFRAIKKFLNTKFDSKNTLKLLFDEKVTKFEQITHNFLTSLVLSMWDFFFKF